jgi:superfamily II DNA or RNA helicase
MLTLPIGTLVTYIEEYSKFKLENNKEVSVDKLQITVPTPSGTAKVRQFVKKTNLPLLMVTLSNGYSFKAATKHIVQVNGFDTFLKDLVVGTAIDHKDSKDIYVTDISKFGNDDCYDIAIDAPHIYYDSNGVVHHNTITTATLAKICEKYGRTVTIVPNKSLVEQTEEDFINCGLDVGVYYGDRKNLDKTHTICTWQSLNILDKKSKDLDRDAEILTLAELLDGVSTVMVDEVHMATASVLKTLLTRNLAHAPIRWGLTGTVPKADHEFQSIRASLGEVINRVSAHELQEKGVLSNCHVNIIQTAEWREFGSYAEELKYLVTDNTRMDYVSDLVNTISASGNTLVLVNRIDSGRAIAERIPGSVFVSGEVKTKDRKEEYDEIKTANNKIIVATYGVAAVGINIPRIFNLVLLEPGKSFVRVIQSIGRGIRKADDKDFVSVWDITASTKYAKRHLTERKRFYKDAKYPFTIEKVKYQ